MALFYPRMQTVIIFVICLIAVGGTAYYLNFDTQTSAQSLQKDAVSLATTTEDLALATSTDWKSQFFSSTTDSGAFSTAGAQKTDAAADQPLTLTDQFGRNLFSRVVTLQQNDQSNDPQAVQTVIDQSMNDIAFGSSQPQSFTSQDVTVSAQHGTDADRVYADTVGSIFYRFAPKDDAAMVADRALEDNDEKELAPISATINSYSSILMQLKNVPVPSELVTYHVALLNGVSAMLFVSQGMNVVFSDPVQGLMALKIYSSAQDTLHDAMVGLNGRLSSEGITFSASEPGNLFATIQ